jgi:TPR repeat protein/transglutaminase-like putative cysteine protease
MLCVLCAHAATAAEPLPALAKANLSKSGASAFSRNVALPKWAAPLEALPATTSDEPVVIRVAETQYWTGASPAYLINRAVQVNSSARLSELGQFAIPFVPAYQKLVLHKIAIVRGAQVLDRTQSANVRVLDSETDAQKGYYLGAATATVLLDDVKPGDTLWTVYSIEGNNPVFGNAWSEHFWWTRDVPVELRKMVLQYPSNKPVQWRVSGTPRPALPAAVTETRNGVTTLVLRETALAADQLEASMPPNTLPMPLIDLSEYRDWSQVAQWALTLFPDMAKQVEVQALARRFDGKTPEQRASQALHWVQDEIRYFSVSMGENSHRPAAPVTVLKRRFGDCKDKTQLLVSLLRAMGIEAQPVLLHATSPTLPAQLLPAPTSFNHAIVRVVLDGKAYFVDPTLQNELGLISTLPVPVPGAAVLIVGADTTGLVSLLDESLAAPLIERKETLVIATLHGDGRLQATTTYRGRYAAGMRQAFHAMGTFDIKTAMLEKYERTYPGVQLDAAPLLHDADGGAAFVVEARFTLPKVLKEEKGRFQLAQRSHILDGTLGIPDKRVRKHPLWLAAGHYRASYSLDVSLPGEARLVKDDSTISVENKFFKAHGQLTWRGAHLNYFVDYAITNPEVAPAELPELAKQAQQLEPLSETKLQFKPLDVPPQTAREASLRLLDIMEKMSAHEELQAEAIRTGKVPEVKFEDSVYAKLDYRSLCESLVDSMSVRQWNPMIGMPIAAYYKVVQARADALTKDICGARLSLINHDLRRASKALAKLSLPDDDPMTLMQAWADFHARSPARARENLARFLKARHKAGTLGADDAVLALALARRLGLPEPEEIRLAAAALRADAWPMPLFAVLRGALAENALFARIAQLPPAAREYATMEAHFVLSQVYLAANTPRKADTHLNWFARFGLLGSAFEVLADADKYGEARNDAEMIEAYAMIAKGLPNGALNHEKDAATRGIAEAEFAIGNRYIKGDNLRQEIAKGVAMLESAAAKGHSGAMNDLGVLYINGSMVPHDDGRGVAWYRQAAANGDSNAAYNLGHLYWFGKHGLPRDFEQSFRFMKDGAEMGDRDAQFFLSRLYFDGKGTAKNDRLAMFWAAQSYFRGSVDGTAQFGLMLLQQETDPKLREAGLRLLGSASNRQNEFAIVEYAKVVLEGIGVDPNPQAAFRLIEYSDVFKRERATALLGRMYAEGLGVRADLPKGLALLEKMEKADVADAYYHLGHVYASPAAGLNDKAKAAAYFRRGAQAGQREAAEALAVMLHTGDGIAVNLPEAVRYYEMAVQSGYPRAMNNLANMYEEGQGVPKDAGKTMELYRNAARLGHPIAMLNLAELYENAAGAGKEAYLPLVYYMLASKYGQAEAQAGVQRLSASGDPAAVAKARAYTLAWKPGKAMPEES